MTHAAPAAGHPTEDPPSPTHHPAQAAEELSKHKEAARPPPWRPVLRTERPGATRGQAADEMMPSMPTTIGDDDRPGRDPDAFPDSTDPSGPCPRCGRISNFMVIEEPVPVTFKKDVFYPGGGRVSYQQVSILECNGCQDRTVIIEDQYTGGVRYGSSGRVTWRGFHWWPPQGAGTFNPVVPAPIAAAYDEAVRCLSVGAPNGAAALLRNVLTLIVADKGTEAAKGKHDLSGKIKQMVRDGGPIGALGDWANHVNLYGNAGAHPEVYGSVSPAEAKDVAALARSMIDLLYEAPAKFARRRAERGR